MWVDPMHTISMAWRNVWRNGRRSAVTITAMAFALWVLVLYSGLVTGYMGGMERDLLDLELGEIQIVGDGYRDDPSLYVAIEDVPALLSKLDAAGLPASARLLGGGLGAVGQQSAGIMLVGLDVARDAQVTQVSEHLAEGQWLDPTRPDDVVLGRRLARVLNASPGDELLVLSQGADGGIANALFTVRGILGSVGDSADRATVFMLDGAFRGLMAMPEGAHQITVRVGDGQDLLGAKASVQAMAPGLDVQTWRELMPTLATMLDSSRALLSVIFFIVYLAIGILVLNAMLMAVFERIREFGVMKAIGYGPFTVFSLIVVESGIQVVLAAVVGVVLALPFMHYLATTGIDVGSLGGTSVMGMSMRQTWHGVFTPEGVAGPVIALVLMVSFAVIWPALRAARIRPLDAMRHQ